MRSKISPEQAKEILALKGSFTQYEIAAMYCVSQPVIGRIHRGEYGGHIPRLGEIIDGACVVCGPTFVLGKPDCPDFQVVVKKPNLPQSVIDAFNNQKSSQANIQVAQNNADAAVKTAQGTAAQQDAVQAHLTPEYLAQEQIDAEKACAANPSCTLVIVPSGGTAGINVNVGKK